MTQTPDYISSPLAPADAALELPASSIARPEPIDRGAPETLARIEVYPLAEARSFVTLKKYEVQRKNDNGENIGDPFTRVVHFKPEQDVLDSLFWFRNDGGELCVVTVERERPALATRNDDFHPNGTQWNLPGRYYVESSQHLSIDDTLKKLSGELGLVAKAPVEILGGSITPYADSPERGYPCAIEIEDPQFSGGERAVYGQAFLRQRVITTQPALDVISDFLRGNVDDLRLVESTLRLLLEKEPEKLTQLLRAELKIAEPVNHTAALSLPTLTKEALRFGLADNPAIATKIDKREVPLSSDDFLSVESYLAQNKNSADQSLGAPYPFDVIGRKRLDFVSAPIFFVHDGVPHLLANIGVRVAQYERNAVLHPIDSKIDPKTVEGVFTSVNHRTADSALPIIASSLVHNRLGLTAVHDPVYVGHGTHSPGYDPGKWNIFLNEINPCIPNASLPQNYYAIDVHSLLQLTQTGEVQSLELALSAHLLAGYFGVTTTDDAAERVSKEGAKELGLLFNSASPKIRLIAQQSPEVFDKLCASREGLRFLNYFANRCKIAFLSSDDAIERQLFDAASHVAPLNVLDASAMAGFLSLHDLFHSFLKEPFPFYRDEQGRFIIADDGFAMWSYEDFRFVTLCNECDASWYSDVYLPQIVGVDAYEKDAGEISMARMLAECGITGRDAEQRAIRSMIIDGVIPRKIADSSHFKAYEGLIAARLIGYHVRDSELNTKAMYNHWKENPLMAEVLARVRSYGPPPAADARDGYSTNSLGTLETYNRGQNRLLEHITDIQGGKIMPALSKLAFLVQHIPSQHPLNGVAKEHVYALVTEYGTLERLANVISDREMTRNNMNALDICKKAVAGAITNAEKFCATVDAQKVPELAGMKALFPASPRIPFAVPELWQTNVAAIISQSLVGTRNERTA